MTIRQLATNRISVAELVRVREPEVSRLPLRGSLFCANCLKLLIVLACTISCSTIALGQSHNPSHTLPIPSADHSSFRAPSHGSYGSTNRVSSHGVPEPVSTSPVHSSIGDQPQDACDCGDGANCCSDGGGAYCPPPSWAHRWFFWSYWKIKGLPSPWHSPGNMTQHIPYVAEPKNYYYFRPYNWFHIPDQQAEAAIYGTDPRNPYDNRVVFDDLYEGLE